MIPFNHPTSAPSALDHLATAIASGKLSGDGPFTKRASEMLSALHDGAPVLLTTSCTHALEMSALLLHLQPLPRRLIHLHRRQHVHHPRT